MDVKINCDVSHLVDSLENKAYQTLVETGDWLGLEAVKEARENGSYTDQTGNLRSSIGYVLVQDGEIIGQSAFEQEPPNKDREQPKNVIYDGGEQGKKFAYELAKKYSKGLVLIVVAGMKYGVYVQEAYNKNVLVSAERVIREKLKELQSKIK